MHSFQPSRGRILFEVLCAVGIGASCGGAWLQTGASALLAAACVATLYGLVHFFDLFRGDPLAATEPQRIDFTPDGEADFPTISNVAAPEPAVKEMVEALALDPRLTDLQEAEGAPVTRNADQADEVVPTKAPRKRSRRTAGQQKKSKSAEPELLAETSAKVPEPVVVEGVTHTQVAPLFEPDPFHRMPRQGFGRRGQI
jgi:hypothetical protein